MRKFGIILLTLPLLSSGAELPDSVLQEVSVTALYRGTGRGTTMIIPHDAISEKTYIQSPDNLLSETPGVFSWSDTGTGSGYTYYKLRGMSQERVNVILDGIEAEDFGCYFSNAPGILGFLESIGISRGATIMGTGTAGYSSGRD